MTRSTIDELEMLNPFELEKLLIAEAQRDSLDVQYIQDIIAVGCPIDAKGGFSQTALHYAAWGGNLELVKFLLSNGADVNARVIWGWTSWDIATNEIKDAFPELRP